MSAVVSIIIVNYNREKYINAAIESVLSQTYREFELLIWDDGSTDRSVEIAREYAKRDRRVKVVAASHQGIDKARKEANAQTSGKYLSWVDRDEVLAPTALEETLAILEDSPQTGLVYRDYLDKETFKRKSARKSLRKSLLGIVACLSLAFSVPLPAAAQQRIIPNRDGTRTIIDRHGNRINIRGGTLSRDGKNLFHSFREFGLDPNQIANFLSNPRIRNILGRINGGNPSMINGLIKVTGGNSNLFLMNPSGIIFGPNARINVPGDFSATTATGIGLEGGWFNAFGPNDYINLVGNPNGFKFEGTEAGTIINAGDLKVREGNNISLIGRQVITLGTIEAPGGTITIAAVPGTSLVRLTQEGQILSLEFELPTDANGNPMPIRVLDLPALLTNAPADLDTGLRVSASGEVELKDSGVAVPNLPGANVVSGNLNVSSARDLGGKIQVVGDRVGLIGANLDASGTNGGGSVLIGGDYKGEGSVPNALTSYVSDDSTIRADATDRGDGGQVIVWADEATRFHGNITARGGESNGNGGFVETSGKYLEATGRVDASATQGERGSWLLDPNNVTISNQPDTNIVQNPVGNFSPNNNDAIVSAQSIETSLNVGTDVTVTTEGLPTDPLGVPNPNNQAGNITVAANITKTRGSEATLTLRAENNIIINPNVQIRSGTPGSVPNPLNVLNVTLNADSDASGAGAIAMRPNSAIISNGGNIILGGGSDPLQFPAVGTGELLPQTNIQLNDGILIDGATLNAGTGNISLRGTGYGDTIDTINVASGIELRNAELRNTDGDITLIGTGKNIAIPIEGIVNEVSLAAQGIFLSNSTLLTQTGDINLTGTGNNINVPQNPALVENISLGAQQGISLSNSTLSTQTGDINLTGTGSNITGDVEEARVFFGQLIAELQELRAQGISFDNFTVVESTQTGNITLTGADINLNSIPLALALSNPLFPIQIPPNVSLSRLEGISLNNASINTNATNSGTVTLTADEINISDTSQIRGGGTLQLQPLTPSLGITVGGTIGNSNDPQSLNLDSTELNTIQNGFSEIFIGRNNSSGEISLAGNVIFNAPVTLRSPVGSGSIDTAGFNITGSNRVTLQAGDSIILGEESIISSPSDLLNVTLNADRDGNGAGAIVMRLGSAIISNGGNITLGGGSNPLEFSAVGIPNNIEGILIDGATLNAGTGNISLRGTGSGVGQNEGYGIGLTNNAQLLTTGTGNITLDGAGSNGTDFNDGIYIFRSRITSVNGDISLTGRGNGSGNGNNGIQIDGDSTIEGNNSRIESTGTGNITLGGTGSNGADFNDGIVIFRSRVTAASGNISFLGRGNGSGRSNNGIQIGDLEFVSPSQPAGGVVESTGTGNITFNGIGANGTSGNSGVEINQEARVTSVNGDISLTGRGNGSGSNNFGIEINNDSNISSIAGSNISLSGQPGSNDTTSIIQRGNSTISSSGTTSLSGTTDRQAVGDINLNNPNNNFNIVAITSGNNVTLNDQNSLVLSTSTIRGTLRVTANDSISTTNENIQAGGDIIFNTVGDISTGDLDTSSPEGSGGNISLTSTNGAIVTGNLNSSGISGGEIRVEASTRIETGEIQSRGSLGSGGNVTLDPTGDIQVTSINAEGGREGRGGNVDITTGRFFRATGTFSAQNGDRASISTIGGLGGGDITIRHGGGQRLIPFVVGDATTNGTAGTITSGEFNIEPLESYLLTFIEGNISLITLDGRTDLEIERLREEIKQEEIQTVQTLPVATIEEAQEILQAIEEDTAKKPALIYISFVPTGYTASDRDFFARSETTLTSDFESFLNVPERKAPLSLSFPPETGDELEILIIPPEGDAKRIRVPNIIRDEIFREGNLMYDEISEEGSDYLEPASKMYQWLIAPIEAELQAKEIENLVFVMPAGLRAVPLAALYDGRTGEYLVQKYSVGLIPSINLVDTRYRNIKNSRVLALGAAQFTPDQDQIELPAVGIEVPLIVEERGGEFFLDNKFTFDNLVNSHQEFSFPIIHLATHADFQTGVPDEIYIQLFDRKLRLNEFRELGLKNPVVDLITISACRTAFGDENAELGYGGLAVQTGAKSALASLWYISDTGTLAFMSNFYNQLKVAPIKAEALRQTQIAMIKNQLRKEGAQIITPTGNVPLPEDLIYENVDLSHPFYWSAFTMIGSPW